MKKITVLAAALSLSLCAASAFGAARDYPVPGTVSPAMQAIIAQENTIWNYKLQTPEDWASFVDIMAAAGRKAAEAAVNYYGVSVEEGSIAGVHTYTITPKDLAEDKQDKVIYFIHGGGYVLGPGISGISEGASIAGVGGYKVVCVDYRLAPEHPYPAATDDALAVYKELINEYDPSKIGVYGTSTGGGMTLILTLQARDQGLPLPGAIAPGTPWSDLDKIGDTYFTNAFLDNMLVDYSGWLGAAAEVYADGHDLKDPYLSPVYGDYTDFPPTLLFSGTRDLFLSCTVRVQEKLLKAGVENNLIVYEGQSHAQYYSDPKNPEHQFHYENLCKFFDEHLK